MIHDDSIMPEYHRNPPTFDVNEVLKSVHLPPWTFNSFLHENYLSFHNDIMEVAQAAEYLSDADVLDSQLNFPYRVSFPVLFLFLVVVRF